MLNMSQINDIREAYAIVGKVAAVAREFNVDEKTVRKYIKQEDFSPRKPIPEERESRLDPYKEQIREWMDADNNIWYKQHHTAQRIHARLKEMYPEFDLSLARRTAVMLRNTRRKYRGTRVQELVGIPRKPRWILVRCDF